MKNWAYLIAVHVFVLGIGGSVHAADLDPEDTSSGSWKGVPFEQPALWDGAYVGVFVGGGSGDADITDEYLYNNYDPIASNSIDTAFSTAGVQIGYNVQRDSFIIGLEAGLGFIDLNGSVTDDDLRPEGSNWNEAAWGKRNGHLPISATYDFSGNLYGELTGRIGYATGNELFYVKGGGAFLNADFGAHYSGNNACTDTSGHTRNQLNWCSHATDRSHFDFSKSEILLGWTVGVGMEYALSSSLSLKAEYQHFDFGSISYDYDGEVNFHERTKGAISTLSGDIDADLTLDLLKVGLNYRLQDEYDVLK